MDLVSIIIQLVVGAVGGNAGGAVVKNASLGTTGNSIVGAVGGIVLVWLISQFTGAPPPDPAATAAATNGMGDIITNVIGGGAGGAILTVIAGLIKNSMNKA